MNSVNPACKILPAPIIARDSFSEQVVEETRADSGLPRKWPIKWL